MRITKFGHSCFMLEKEGEKLLIDPGAFCFIEGILKPEDIPTPDVVLITHTHLDHCDPAALKKIIKKQTLVLANHEVCEVLAENKIPCEEISGGHTRSVHDFDIHAINCQHVPIFAKLPENTAFLIDGTFLHPGDSTTIHGIDCRVVLLPIGPYASPIESAKMARLLMPDIVIPCHDAALKQFLLERMIKGIETVLPGVKIVTLKQSESFEII